MKKILCLTPYKINCNGISSAEIVAPVRFARVTRIDYLSAKAEKSC